MYAYAYAYAYVLCINLLGVSALGVCKGSGERLVCTH